MVAFSGHLYEDGGSMIQKGAIPDDIITALKGIVDKVPEKDVLEYVRHHKDDLCAGGFQPHKKHINLFRERLRCKIRSTSNTKSGKGRTPNPVISEQ